MGVNDEKFHGEKGQQGDRFDTNLGGDDRDHYSVYAGSAVERMPENSIDKDEPKGYPINNEEVVKRHAIMERRHMVNSRNFERKL